MLRVQHALEAALVVAIASYCLVAPYTKVEESFSLHAVHDFLSLGLQPSQLANYDHITFPGAVPRSFIGPLALAGATWPFLALGKQMHLWTTGVQAQLLVRLVLGGLSGASLIFLSRRVRDAFKHSTANIFLMLTLTQFHTLYYASRPLPNMFAFPLVQVAVAMIIAPWPRKTRKGKGSRVEVLESFAVLTFVAIVMRLEVSALLASLAWMALKRGTVKLDELVKVGVVMSMLSLAATYLVDSHFWRQPVWPEGSSAFFNVVEGHASDWGTSPWHYYFTRSLPRLLPSVPIAVWSMFIDRRSRSIGYPCLAFVALMSFLGHKEWRFIVYALPALTACSAAGFQSLGHLYSKRTKRMSLCFFLGVNVAASFFTLYASVHNYPGGHALSELASLRSIGMGPITVHIDSHAAMTGASRFLHPFEAPPWYLTSNTKLAFWTFDKNETLVDFSGFDFLVTGQREREGFRMLKAVEGFVAFRPRLPTVSQWLPIEAIEQDSVWVLQRQR